MKRNRQFDELLARVPEETKRRVEKQMTCKWLRNGEECGKGLPGTPCDVVGCVAWEHYEAADKSRLRDKESFVTTAKKELECSELLAEVRLEALKEIRGLKDKLEEICDSTHKLIQAVEGYVCPKKGDKYVFRNEVLAKCNQLKKLLDEKPKK